MMAFWLCKFEQFDLLNVLNIQDWGFLGYAFMNTPAVLAPFFLVLVFGLLSLFFLHHNYNGFWLTPELMVLTFQRCTSLRPLRHARYSAVTLASVVHLLSVAFFGMLSQKYCLGFDVALVESLPLAQTMGQSQTVVAAAVETATLTAQVAPLAPLATAVKVVFYKTVGVSYKLAQPIPLPFIIGDGTVEGAMKVIANHTFYLCFWDLDLPSRVALVQTLSAAGDYGRLFLYASPYHNGLHISVKLLQVLSSPRNAAEQARSLAIAQAFELDHPIKCYQWLIMPVPPL